jgi:hypothetical protein
MKNSAHARRFPPGIDHRASRDFPPTVLPHAAGKINAPLEIYRKLAPKA